MEFLTIQRLQCAIVHFRGPSARATGIYADRPTPLETSTVVAYFFVQLQMTIVLQ